MAASTGRARSMLRRAMVEELSGPDGSTGVDATLVDTVLLLASELCDNAVLHAGTEFEVELSITDAEVEVGVTDHGGGPLELYLSNPRPRFGRAATHGRGLMLVERMATTWGTRHEHDGRHRTWFALRRGGPDAGPDAGPEPGAGSGPEGRDELAVEAWTGTAADRPGGAVPDRASDRAARPAGAALNNVTQITDGEQWPDAEQLSRLLHVPAELGHRMEMSALVAELTRRLREVLRADGVTVEVDQGDGAGPAVLARDGAEPGPGSVALPLPLTSPLRGALRIQPGAGRPVPPRTVELSGQRIALAVETDWLRDADLRRRAWMAYLADASELLGQSMDAELVVALVAQVVVPRLGEWCSVHLVDETGKPRLAALTHASEDVIPSLRAALEPHPPAELGRELAGILAGSGNTSWFGEPTDGVAVPLTARGAPTGVLVVGRPSRRPHTPEDVALIGDIARRASLAIDNARTAAAHIATSQALQKALLPRALPVAPGVEFAAEYLPATAGSDVSGDFYDVVDIDADHWLVSVGDVCGKGARAAARTGMVRDVLRVLIREGRSLTRAVELLNDVMMDVADPSQFCTLALARIGREVEAGPGGGPGGLTVDLVLAGHPQPVLVRGGGDAELVGTYGTAVGLTREVRLTATRHHLAAGDTLLAYTDGVTERRVGKEQFGSERLLAAAAKAAGQSAAGLVASVRSTVRSWSADARGDDIALLAIRASSGQPVGMRSR